MQTVPHDLLTRRSLKARRLLATLVAVCFCLGAGWFAWHVANRPQRDRAERLFFEARSFHAAGDNRRAEQTAVAASRLDSKFGPAALLAAESAASQGEFQRAIDHLGQATSTDPGFRLQAALLTAKLNHHRLYHLTEAERAYRAALELAPDSVEANSGLARLLGLCGRKDEAVPNVLRLVRQGQVGDLLIMLGRRSVVVHDPTLLESAREAAPDDPNVLLALAWHAASSEETDPAIDLLQRAIQLQPDHVAAHVALGRQLFEAQRLDDLGRWEANLPAAADEFAETWTVRARMAENDGDLRRAIRCYLESARRAPESKTANFRLARLLAEVGDAKTSEQFAERVRRIIELETTQDRFHYAGDYLLELARSYEAAGRLWEAYGWCRQAVQLEQTDEGAWRTFRKMQLKVEQLPLRLTIDSANPALHVDLSNYPMPRFHAVAAADTPVTSAAMSFREEAASVGLAFRFFNGTTGPPTRRMFEFTGGGAGVLDFDLDGFPDLFFTQGRPWLLDEASADYIDTLFWNRAGAKFETVSASARIREHGFGQGVAVGDFDSDGFPDLYVANIGANVLWRNNGDGTFTDATSEAMVAGAKDEWTTSCVLADLNGDGLPDIYAVNYVTAGDVFDRVCQDADGSPQMCMPYDFEGQPDRLWLNDGNGRFTDVTATALTIQPNGKGLGVAAWDANGSGRLSLLVANDTTPNFFFVPETTAEHPFRLVERGIPAGLALNGEGKATGCMGIALGDVNGDGKLDVHITNFLSEPNTLFLNVGGGLFEDRTRALGLHYATLDVLGFGTQFLDMDLDGHLELFVSNGHIDDLRRSGRPYRMRPQLFRWTGQRFDEVPAAEAGLYFQQQWLGRSVARLDWNRDGLDDLIVGHLQDESVLLTNTTHDAGRFLSVKLFGVHSNRDAIGTTIRVRVGERAIVRQLTAGDGYQASNERRVIVGVGSAEQIEELVVRWPSGLTQRFENVSTSQEVWLPEGCTLVVTPISKE